MYKRQDPEDPEYLKHLYLVYRVQGYLRDHAGNLEQMTVQQGNEKYEVRRPLFAIVPAVSILWGAAALVMVAKLNRSVQRSIVRPLAVSYTHLASSGNMRICSA